MTYKISSNVARLVLRIGQKMIDLFYGKLKVTPPRFVFFYVGRGSERRSVILMETNMYSTVTRGWHVEFMRLLVARGEGIQSFSQWLYEEAGEIYGSGLFVPATGRHLCVYFQLPEGEQEYQFMSNNYCISVQIGYAGKKERTIWQSMQEINNYLSEAMRAGEIGIEFTWQGAFKRYVARQCPVNIYSETIEKRY